MPAAPARRPLTDAEYRQLTPQQRVLLGLDDPTEAAPADFGGAVLPNPNHLRPLADTDSGIEPTRLPDGIKFQHDNFRGPMGTDVSNPATAELITPTMQGVAAKNTGAPVSAAPVALDMSTAQPIGAGATGATGAVGAPVKLDMSTAQPLESPSTTEPGLWDKVKSFFNDDSLTKQARANYEKAHGKVEMPGSGEGANLMQNLSDWDKASGGELGGGVHDILKGDVAKGLHRIIGGAGAATLPATALVGPTAVARAPLATALSVGGGAVGSQVARAGAEAVGATPDQADLASDVGGIVGGYGGAKLPGAASAVRAAAANETSTTGKIVASAKVLGASAEELPGVGHAMKAVKKLGALRDIWSPKANPDLSLDNITDALAETIARDRAAQSQAATLGKLPATGAQPAAQTGEALATQPQLRDLSGKPNTASAAPRFTVQDRAAAKSLLTDALEQHTADVVDHAIPGKNAAVKAQVETALKNGDVAGAEAALDKGAKEANPSWQPLDRKRVPTVNEIRDRVQAEAKLPAPKTLADLADDRALQQEMNWDLQRHGWAAESEARREFIARNSTGMTKGELAKRFSAKHSGSASGTAAQPASAAGTTADDLTSALQNSLDEVRKRQAKQ